MEGLPPENNMGTVKAEELRSAVDTFSPEVLRDALVLLLSSDKENNKGIGTAELDRPVLANFAQALLYLKKHFSFPELELFSTEGDLVYVHADDRKILLTDRVAVQSEPKTRPAPVITDSGRFSNLEFTDNI